MGTGFAAPKTNWPRVAKKRNTGRIIGLSLYGQGLVGLESLAVVSPIYRLHPCGKIHDTPVTITAKDMRSACSILA
jgi:hypothetical protein